ncbi:MAG: helix-turn-helix transcriptional regulator [Acidimicrobiales bacterium]
MGRDRERTDLGKLLETERAVTLTGPEGIGKSRLASQVAIDADGSGDGTCRVDLARLVDGGLVAQSVACALGVRQAPGRSAIDSVADALGDHRLLLVLDSCEGAARACAGVVQHLLGECPEVAILATSRSRLTSRGETVLRLGPLGVPDAAETSPDSVAGYDAVALFGERARTVGPGFSLDGAGSARHVAEICRILGGNPEAIELAAARMGLLEPGRIAHDLAAAVGAQRSQRAPNRRPLAACVAWSYEQLPATERVLLDRLSVFVGWCTLASVEGVCSGEALEPGDVFEALAGLVAASLVVADTAGPVARYRLPDAVRRHAGDRLADGRERPDVVERHADWFTAMAERSELEIDGEGGPEWLTAVDNWTADLRAVLERSVKSHHRTRSFRLSASLARYWAIRGALDEGRASITGSLAAPGDRAGLLDSRLLWGAGLLACRRDDTDAARPVLEESLAIGRALGDDRACARALLLLAECARQDEAEMPTLDESTTLADRAGDAWCLARGLARRASLCTGLGRVDEAHALLERSAAVARRASDSEAHASVLIGLGNAAFHRGDSWPAETLLSEGLRLAAERWHEPEMAMGLAGLGMVAHGQGDAGIADEHFREALARARRSGARGAATTALRGLARLALERGDPVTARRHLEDALAGTGQGAAGRVALLCALGQVAAAEGDPAGAQASVRDAIEAGQGRPRHLGGALLAMGNLVRRNGDHVAASWSFCDAMAAFEAACAPRGTVDALEALAGTAALSGQHLHATRLFGAAATARTGNRFARFAPESPHFDEDVALLREHLSSEDFDGAWREGAALSLPGAVALARQGAGESWDRLTKAERAVVALVAEGLTNRQVGERLFISRHTVQTHLAHVFAKLGIGSRTVLAAAAIARQQVTNHTR